MKVRVHVVAAGEPPPAGAPFVVQVRDTALQDAPATVVAEKRGKVKSAARGGEIAVAELDVPAPGSYPTVYVHVDVDGDGRVDAGDYITMQSHPCRDGDMTVEVKRVS